MNEGWDDRGSGNDGGFRMGKGGRRAMVSSVSAFRPAPRYGGFGFSRRYSCRPGMSGESFVSLGLSRD